jgi:hypothetical protein
VNRDPRARPRFVLSRLESRARRQRALKGVTEEGVQMGTKGRRVLSLRAVDLKPAL